MKKSRDTNEFGRYDAWLPAGEEDLAVEVQRDLDVEGEADHLRLGAHRVGDHDGAIWVRQMWVLHHGARDSNIVLHLGRGAILPANDAVGVRLHARHDVGHAPLDLGEVGGDGRSASDQRRHRMMVVGVDNGTKGLQTCQLHRWHGEGVEPALQQFAIVHIERVEDHRAVMAAQILLYETRDLSAASGGPGDKVRRKGEVVVADEGGGGGGRHGRRLVGRQRVRPMGDVVFVVVLIVDVFFGVFVVSSMWENKQRNGENKGGG